MMEGAGGQTRAECEQFRFILKNILSSNNDIRTKAENEYDAVPVANKVYFLLTILGGHNIAVEESELAAVLLRRLLYTEFDTVYPALSPEFHVQLKNQLLHHIQQDINHTLRKKICDTAAELARNLIDDDGNNQWPEFLKFLFDCASSENCLMRESSLLMFSAVPGIFGNQQKKYLDVIRQMLLQSLIDRESPDVRIAAVKATTSFVLAHEKEIHVIKHFSECLTLLLQILHNAIRNSENCAEEILRQLIELVETCPQFFRGHLDSLMSICLEGLEKNDSSESSRHLSLEVIVALCETAPAMVRKLGIKHIGTLIPIIFRMMTDLEEDPGWENMDEDDEEDIDSNSSIGESSLDRLSCALGGKTVFPFIMNMLPQMLNSDDWKQRYAALMAISAIGEGCEKQMSLVLPHMVDAVIMYLGDHNSRVRYAACNALGQMATDFGPVFQKKFHGKVIPNLLQVLGDPSCERVQAHAGAALVNFFEDSPKSVLSQYMDSIIQQLESVMKHKFHELVETGKKLVLEQAVLTLASLADSVGEKFLSYYDRFMPCLKFIVQNAFTNEYRILRGKAIECISLIGMAVGKDKFIDDASDVMDVLLKTQTSESALMDDDPQLPYMIAAWARMCKILGQAFEPYLPYVMQPVLKTASLKPEIAVLDSDDMKLIENDDDWEFVNLGEKHSFGIHTTGLDDKATACQMLVCYARELKEGFSPYVEETLKLMVPMLKFYFHDGVRMAAAEILPYLLESAKFKGESYVQEMWKFVLPSLLHSIETEPEIEVLSEHMSALARCVEVQNYQCLSQEEMLFLIKIFNKNLEQHFDKDRVREEKRKEEDYDEIVEESLGKEDEDGVLLLSRITEVLCSLFSVYKEDLLIYFDMLLQHLIHLLEPNRPWSDIQWSLCMFADMIENSAPACSRYQQYFIQPMLSAINHEVNDVRQIGAYLVGALGQHGGDEFFQICSDSIPLLVQMINSPGSRSEENTRATETAICAITKLMASNNNLINKNELVPIWFSWLPIWENLEDVDYIYNFLCSMLEQNNELFLGVENCNLPRIVAIFADSFYKEAFTSSPEVGKRVLALIHALQNDTSLFSICVDHLTESQRQALHLALSGN